MRFKKEFAAIAGGLALSGGAIAAEQALLDRGQQDAAKVAFAVMLGGALSAGTGLGMIVTANDRRRKH